MIALALLLLSAEPALPKVLVLDVKSASLDAPAVQSLTQLITVEMGKSKRYSVVNIHEVARLADLEADRQDAGCTTTSCLAELAGAYGAELVVFGDEGALGESHVITLQLFDAKRAVARGRSVVTVRDLGDLPREVPRAVEELLAGNAAEPTASTTKTKQPASASSGSTAGAIIGYGIAGLGLAAGTIALLAGSAVLTTPSDSDTAPLGFGLFGLGAASVIGGGIAAYFTYVATQGGSE